MDCNKCNVPMIKANDNYALIKITKNNEQILFHGDSGLPVTVYFCPNCGKLEIYSAKFLNEI